MTWQLAIILRIIIGNILSPIFFKKTADSELKTRQQFLIYAFCVIFSFVFLLYLKFFIFSFSVFIVATLGLLNSFAFWSHLRAVEISQSKASVFMPGSDIFALLLGFIFLKEWQLLNPFLLLGILLIISAAALLFIGREKEKHRKKFFSWVIVYIFIWGLVAFFMRYFALEGLTFAEFDASWYSSAWLGSLLIFILAKDKEKKFELRPAGLFNAFGIALFMWVSLFLSYTALERAPIAVIQPILMASGMIFPILSGLFIFKEIKQISKIEMTYSTNRLAVSIPYSHLE